MNFIINPQNNQQYSIFSRKGKKILKQYIQSYVNGGMEKPMPAEEQPVIAEEQPMVATVKEENKPLILFLGGKATGHDLGGSIENKSNCQKLLDNNIVFMSIVVKDEIIEDIPTHNICTICKLRCKRCPTCAQSATIGLDVEGSWDNETTWDALQQFIDSKFNYGTNTKFDTIIIPRETSKFLPDNEDKMDMIISKIYSFLKEGGLFYMPVPMKDLGISPTSHCGLTLENKFHTKLNEKFNNNWKDTEIIDDKSSLVKINVTQLENKILELIPRYHIFQKIKKNKQIKQPITVHEFIPIINKSPEEKDPPFSCYYFYFIYKKETLSSSPTSTST